MKTTHVWHEAIHAWNRSGPTAAYLDASSRGSGVCVGRVESSSLG